MPRSHHALLFSVESYRHITPLSTPARDARRLADWLAEGSGEPFTIHGPLLNATREEMESALESFPADQPGLCLVVAFSGHGVALESPDSRPAGYLLPVDAEPNRPDTWIPISFVLDQIRRINPHHLLLILDCCFAGSVRWSLPTRSLDLRTPKKIYRQRFSYYRQHRAWLALTSAAADEEALDSLGEFTLGARGETRGHSPFLEQLLTGLRGAADLYPPNGGDGIITATELWVYARDQVLRRAAAGNHRQTPMLYPLLTDEEQKGEFFFLMPGFSEERLESWNREDNPYKGLHTYGEADAHLLYGRDEALRRLWQKFQGSGPLLVVTGVSGSGKSSMVRAGLLPRLRRNLPGLAVFSMSPGKMPAQTLRAVLAQVRPGPHRYLFIDQLEEVFTQCRSEEERQAFFAALADLLAKEPVFTKIIVTVRSDYAPRFKQSALSTWWEAGLFPTPWFELEELREVIVKPAAQAGVGFEPNRDDPRKSIVNRMIEEVLQSPGALPMLSFALYELYELFNHRRLGDRPVTEISEGDYEQLKGVLGAIGRKADEFYQGLTPNEQATLQRVLLRMVSMAGSEAAKKRVYEAELTFGSPAENDRVQTVLRRLVATRLVLAGTDPGGSRRYYEPAHDALLTSWPVFAELIDRYKSDIILLDKLRKDLEDYQENPEEKRLYDKNPRLDSLVDLQQRDPLWLNAQESTFVQTSLKVREQRRRQVLRNAIMLIVLFAGLSVAASVFGVRSRNLATISSMQRDSIQEQSDSLTSAYQTIIRQNDSLVLSSFENALSRAAQAQSEKRFSDALAQYDAAIDLAAGRDVLTERLMHVKEQKAICQQKEEAYRQYEDRMSRADELLSRDKNGELLQAALADYQAAIQQKVDAASKAVVQEKIQRLQDRIARDYQRMVSLAAAMESDKEYCIAYAYYRRADRIQPGQNAARQKIQELQPWAEKNCGFDVFAF